MSREKQNTKSILCTYLQPNRIDIKVQYPCMCLFVRNRDILMGIYKLSCHLIIFSCKFVVC